jgi:hypothetical protein
MLRELAPGQVWCAEAPFGKLGVNFGARMTVARLPSGDLWVHSPIGLSAELKRSLDALGPVRHLVSPSRFHYMHVPEFARAYPEARLHAVPGSLKRLKRLGAPRLLEDAPDTEWGGVFAQGTVRGSALYDEVDFVHLPSRTLVVTDLCFNIPPDSSWMTRLAASSFDVLGRLSPSRSFRWFLRDRDAMRATLERILSWDFDRVTVAHGAVVPTGGKSAFRGAFAWLLEEGRSRR